MVFICQATSLKNRWFCAHQLGRFRSDMRMITRISLDLISYQNDGKGSMIVGKVERA
jgi:hypothetical protein